MLVKLSVNKFFAFSVALMIGLYSVVFYFTSSAQYEKSIVKLKPQKNVGKTCGSNGVVDKCEIPKDSEYIEEFDCIGKKSNIKLLRKTFSKFEGSGISGQNHYGYNHTNKIAKKKSANENGDNVGIKILSKPRPIYTCKAKINNVQGVVRLKVTFLMTGKIGEISVIKGLSDCLNERAIVAARKIKFVAPKRNGKKYSVSKVVKFNFTIY